MRMCTKCDAETASTIGFSGEELCSTCYAAIPLHIRKMDIGEAKETSIYVQVYVKGGGQQSIGIPAGLLTGLIHKMQTDGNAIVHLGDGVQL